MKNFLEYYFNLLNLTVHEKDENYYFDYARSKYIFVNTKRSFNEINAIYKINNSLPKYHKIIPNKDNSPITYLNNKIYVMLKIENSEEQIGYNNFQKYRINIDKEINVLLRNDWNRLIETKIDYLEYQRLHLNKEYKVLDETFDYYLGMTENSLEYLNNANLKEKKTELDDLVVCHKRISSLNSNFFYNPLSIVVDHSSREVSEYLKYLFFNNSYDINILKKVFNNTKFSKYGYQLLLSRMLYPSFYFDEYEKIVNGQMTESSILKIVSRVDEYEKYLNIIYDLISSKIKIPSIDWI